MSRVKDMSTLLATLNPSRWFTGLWRNPDFREVVGLAHAPSISAVR